jgi:hypothetical protein
MAGPTLMCDLRHELIELDGLDLMSRMTIFTVRELIGSIRDGRTVNTFLEIFVNALVADGTGRWNDLVMDCGPFIFAFEYEV